MNAQNIILSLIVIALIMLTVMVAKGKEINITVPAAKIDVLVPALGLPQDDYTQPIRVIVKTIPVPYESRYIQDADLIVGMVDRIAKSIEGSQNWTHTTTVAYRGAGKWECIVEYVNGGIEIFVFDEVTGIIQ